MCSRRPVVIDTNWLINTTSPGCRTFHLSIMSLSSSPTCFETAGPLRICLASWQEVHKYIIHLVMIVLLCRRGTCGISSSASWFGYAERAWIHWRLTCPSCQCHKRSSFWETCPGYYRRQRDHWQDSQVKMLSYIELWPIWTVVDFGGSESWYNLSGHLWPRKTWLTFPLPGLNPE